MANAVMSRDNSGKTAQAQCIFRAREIKGAPHNCVETSCCRTPQCDKVRTEMECMDSMDVISRVTQPTPQCAGMVVVPKPNGKIQLCVDLTNLNRLVLRERYICLHKWRIPSLAFGRSRWQTKAGC